MKKQIIVSLLKLFRVGEIKPWFRANPADNLIESLEEGSYSTSFFEDAKVLMLKEFTGRGSLNKSSMPYHFYRSIMHDRPLRAAIYLILIDRKIKKYKKKIERLTK